MTSKIIEISDGFWVNPSRIEYVVCIKLSKTTPEGVEETVYRITIAFKSNNPALWWECASLKEARDKVTDIMTILQPEDFQEESESESESVDNEDTEIKHD